MKHGCCAAVAAGLGAALRYKYTRRMVGALIRYLRKHRWQRRLLTGLLAIIVGGLLGILLWPHYQHWSASRRDESLVRDLGSENARSRTRAMATLKALAAESEDTFDRLVDGLATDSDRQFVSVVGVLRALARQSPEMRRRAAERSDRLNAALETDSELRFTTMVALLQLLGTFDVPGRNPVHVDRLNAIYLAIGQERTGDEHVDVRWTTLAQVLTGGRDNRYVRQALALACADGDASVRELASMLAGRLGDDRALGRLLSGKDAAVASAAALSAAAGGRTALVAVLRDRLTAGGGDEVVSATAYALARLDASASAKGICEILLDAESSPALRDRLLHVMAVLNNDAARKAVSSVLASARREQRYPPAPALLAAGKLKMPEAEPDVRAVLTDSRKQGRRHIGHLKAAFRAAELLDLPVREEMFLLCRDAWGRWEPLTAMSAMRELGRQAAKDQPHDKSTRDQCISLLRLAAATGHGKELWPGRAEPIAVEPTAAAAAAVALWLLDAEACGEKRIRNATHHKDEDKSLPSDYVSWHLAANGRPEAMMRLGMAMLPPLRGGVFDDQERAGGAMLMALAAGTDKHNADAVARIRLRLKHEDNALIRGAYRCALLMLGQSDELETVRALRGITNFPRRRVMTALLAVGDKGTLDWFLLDRHKPLDDVAGLLTTALIGEVLAAAAPGLPGVDPAGDGAMQAWQSRILRHAWGVRRGTIAVGLQR